MHLGGQIICKVLLYRFSFFFLFQNQIENDVYVFLNDIIRFFGYKIESTLLFCDKCLYDYIYYDEYIHCFLQWEFLEQLFFSECIEESVRAYNIVHHFQNRSTYRYWQSVHNLPCMRYPYLQGTNDFCFGGSELFTTSVLERATRESHNVVETRIKSVLPVFVLAVFT